MIGLIQRVSSASVTVGNKITGKIKNGFLIFLCVVKGDEEKHAKVLAEKITKLRIFDDNAGKFNFELKNIDGELLVVSQFTLSGDCKKGKRPSFTNSAPPDKAEYLYNFFIKECENLGFNVETGEFAASMQVSLTNDGPVTLNLNTDDFNI